MSDERSNVTEWLQRFKAEDAAAEDRLFQRYFERMVKLARDHLRGASRRVADEEDVALSAFDSFCLGVHAGRFPRLNDRDDLWRVLITITKLHAHDLRAHERRQKRGGGKVRGNSALEGPDQESGGAGGFDRFASPDPSPEEAAELAEETERKLQLLTNPKIREVAILKLQGHTNAEIASIQQCVVTTVERRLQLIRRAWQEGKG